jgi:Na+-transporting methylmalonyl-CoA/oxaloacetate decarboxylase gamma subunit
MVAVALLVLGLLGFVLGSWGAAVRRAEMEHRKQEEQDLIREKQAEAERVQRSTDTGAS